MHTKERYMPESFHQLRRLAGHTQEEAARYLYTSRRVIQRIEAGQTDQARTELYELKLKKDGLL